MHFMRNMNALLRLSRTSQTFFVLRNITCQPLDARGFSNHENSSKFGGQKLDGKKLLENAASFDERLNEEQVQFEGSAYPEREKILNQKIRSPKENEVLKDVDDSLNSVLIFPGQGSQYVGMGKKIKDIKNGPDLFEKASSILEFDLLKVCLEGPQSKLDMTLYSQPAVVVTSLAAVEYLFQENPKMIENCVATAGLSVGEITALIFSGALSFEDGIRFVKARAESMQYCSDMESSGMMTVFFGANAKLGLACEAARKWTAEKFSIPNPVCQVANFLYSGSKVIAGHEECLQFINDHRGDFGIRRTKRLPVSGAFHTQLMRPAADLLRETLKSIPIHDPRIPVYSNMEGYVFTREKVIRRMLGKQVMLACKWEQCLNKMFDYTHAELFPKTMACGPGAAALCGMLMKINGKAGRKATAVTV